jgi:hypothetical protein
VSRGKNDVAAQKTACCVVLFPRVIGPDQADTVVGVHTVLRTLNLPQPRLSFYQLDLVQDGVAIVASILAIIHFYLLQRNLEYYR